ncbi:hypothetical protein [Kribbella solani]|uniref:Uncharacterized protein n=1 Tax=Kribbella solani TaxID=236067 RepID=A0A841DQ06_9ACTN|nr:hypothetical protein [Kribbella solani]MBB5978467.1 hypothetical protein [Kribbella solani]
MPDLYDGLTAHEREYVLTRQLMAVLLDRLQSTRARLLDLYADHG